MAGFYISQGDIIGNDYKIEVLVKRFLKYPCLWDINHNSFKKKEVRYNAVSAIASKYLIEDAAIYINLKSVLLKYLKRCKELQAEKNNYPYICISDMGAKEHNWFQLLQNYFKVLTNGSQSEVQTIISALSKDVRFCTEMEDIQLVKIMWSIQQHSQQMNQCLDWSLIAKKLFKKQQIVKKMWWSRRFRVLKKLGQHFQAEDCPAFLAPKYRLSKLDWSSVDYMLMYESIHIVTETSLSCYMTLRALVDIFHLVQRFQIEECPKERLLEAWSAAHTEYTKSGKICSPLLLQRRWYELKKQTREKFYRFWTKLHSNMLTATLSLLPLYQAIAKRFPHVILEPHKSWQFLKDEGLVFTSVKIENIQNTSPEAYYKPLDDDITILEPTVETINVDEVDDKDGSKRNQSCSKFVHDKQLENYFKTRAELFSHILFEDDDDDNIETENIYDDQSNDSVYSNKQNKNNGDDNVDNKPIEVYSLSESDGIQKETKLLLQDIQFEEEEYQRNIVPENTNQLDEKLFMIPKVVLNRLEYNKIWNTQSVDGTINLKKPEFQELIQTIKVFCPIIKSEILHENVQTEKKKIDIALNIIETVANTSDTLRASSSYTKSKSLSNKKKYKYTPGKLQTNPDFNHSLKSFEVNFLSARSKELLEQCSPLTVDIENLQAICESRNRAPRKVTLPSIDEVRKFNSEILTAKVLPIATCEGTLKDSPSVDNSPTKPPKSPAPSTPHTDPTISRIRVKIEPDITNVVPSFVPPINFLTDSSKDTKLQEYNENKIKCTTNNTVSIKPAQEAKPLKNTVPIEAEINSEHTTALEPTTDTIIPIEQPYLVMVENVNQHSNSEISAQEITVGRIDHNFNRQNQERRAVELNEQILKETLCADVKIEPNDQSSGSSSIPEKKNNKGSTVSKTNIQPWWKRTVTIDNFNTMSSKDLDNIFKRIQAEQADYCCTHRRKFEYINIFTCNVENKCICNNKVEKAIREIDLELLRFEKELNDELEDVDDDDDIDNDEFVLSNVGNNKVDDDDGDEGVLVINLDNEVNDCSSHIPEEGSNIKSLDDKQESQNPKKKGPNKKRKAVVKKAEKTVTKKKTVDQTKLNSKAFKAWLKEKSLCSTLYGVKPKVNVCTKETEKEKKSKTQQKKPKPRGPRKTYLRQIIPTVVTKDGQTDIDNIEGASDFANENVKDTATVSLNSVDSQNEILFDTYTETGELINKTVSLVKKNLVAVMPTDVVPTVANSEDQNSECPQPQSQLTGPTRKTNVVQNVYKISDGKLEKLIPARKYGKTCDLLPRNAQALPSIRKPHKVVQRVPVVVAQKNKIFNNDMKVTAGPSSVNSNEEDVFTLTSVDPQHQLHLETLPSSQPLLCIDGLKVSVQKGSTVNKHVLALELPTGENEQPSIPVQDFESSDIALPVQPNHAPFINVSLEVNSSGRLVPYIQVMPKKKMPNSITVQQFIIGKDITTLFVLRIDQNGPLWRLAPEKLLVTANDLEMAKETYFTLADETTLSQHIKFKTKRVIPCPKDNSDVLQLLDDDPPEKMSLGHSLYVKLTHTPLIYAQVYSVLRSVNDIRYLIKKNGHCHLFFYNRITGSISPVKIVSTVRPNNIEKLAITSTKANHDCIKNLLAEMESSKRPAPTVKYVIDITKDDNEENDDENNEETEENPKSDDNAETEKELNLVSHHLLKRKNSLGKNQSTPDIEHISSHLIMSSDEDSDDEPLAVIAKRKRGNVEEPSIFPLDVNSKKRMNTEVVLGL